MICAYVEWVDSMHLDAWQDMEDIPPAKHEVSCGILVKEAAEWVTLALSHAPETNQYGHLITIPRVAIKSMQTFQKPSRKRAKASEAGVA